MMQVNANVQIAVYALTSGVGVAGAILVTGLVMRSSGRLGVATGIALAAWFAIANAGAAAWATAPVAVFGLRAGLPLVAGLLAIALLPSLRRLTADPDLQPALIAVQTFRVVGGVFLVLMALSALPPVFAIPAGTGDVLVGVTAIGVARSLQAGRTGPAIAWNLLGLLDLVVAVSIGVMASPGPQHLIDATPSTAALTALPVALVPTFGVPLAVLMHVVSLRSLLGRRSVVATAPA